MFRSILYATLFLQVMAVKLLIGTESPGGSYAVSSASGFPGYRSGYGILARSYPGAGYDATKSYAHLPGYGMAPRHDGVYEHYGHHHGYGPYQAPIYSPYHLHGLQPYPGFDPYHTHGSYDVHDHDHHHHHQVHPPPMNYMTPDN